MRVGGGHGPPCGAVHQEEDGADFNLPGESEDRFIPISGLTYSKSASMIAIFYVKLTSSLTLTVQCIFSKGYSVNEQQRSSV